MVRLLAKFMYQAPLNHFYRSAHPKLDGPMFSQLGVDHLSTGLADMEVKGLLIFCLIFIKLDRRLSGALGPTVEYRACRKGSKKVSSHPHNHIISSWIGDLSGALGPTVDYRACRNGSKRSLLIIIITSCQVGSASCPVLGGIPTVNHRLAEMEVKGSLVIFICFSIIIFVLEEW